MLLWQSHHGDTPFLLPPTRQEATPQLARQPHRTFFGDSQGQHVAAVTRQTDKNWSLLRGVRDGDDGDHVRIVWELGNRKTCRKLGHVAAPRAADLLLGVAHLCQTHRTARVPAVQELGPPAWTVVVKADLTLHQRILREGVHFGNTLTLCPGGNVILVMSQSLYDSLSS